MKNCQDTKSYKFKANRHPTLAYRYRGKFLETIVLEVPLAIHMTNNHASQRKTFWISGKGERIGLNSV